MTDNFTLNVIDSLPEWQRVFCHSPTFKACIKLIKEMEDLLDETDQWKCKQNELMHAKMIFDDLCEKDPECLKEKKNVEERNAKEINEKRLLALFENHKKIILQD